MWMQEMKRNLDNWQKAWVWNTHIHTKEMEPISSSAGTQRDTRKAISFLYKAQL